MKKKGVRSSYYVYSLFILSLISAIMIFSAYSAFAQCIKDDKAKDGRLCQTLYAGQFIDAGLVCAEIIDTNGDNKGDTLVVSYSTTGGWELTEAHLWVGNELTRMPQTRQGNPKIGNFPNNSGNITGQTYYEFRIGLCCLGYECGLGDKIYYVAAHAALRKPDGTGGYLTETGWADGDLFVQRGAWGTYFTFTLTCNNCNDYSVKCETAFAYGYPDTTAICFLNIDENGDGKGDFNRWGWTNGQLSLGVGVQASYTFKIYAGAGQCNISKGTFVGNLTVGIDGYTVTVTYIMNPGFVLNETHLYLGNEMLPRDVNGDFTVAPGQYPLVDDELRGISSKRFISTLPNTVSSIYIVAHAVVCPEL